MEKKVSTKMDPSVPPNCDKNITEERSLVVVREAIWCIGHPTLQVGSSLTTWNRFVVYTPLHSNRRVPTANPGREARAAVHITGRICAT